MGLPSGPLSALHLIFLLPKLLAYGISLPIFLILGATAGGYFYGLHGALVGFFAGIGSSIVFVHTVSIHGSSTVRIVVRILFSILLACGFWFVCVFLVEGK